MERLKLQVGFKTKFSYLTKHFFVLILFINSNCFSYTLEEKLGQMLIVHVDSDSQREVSTCINECLVGGVILYDFLNDLSSKHKVKLLTDHLQNQVKKNKNPFPLFISLDQEGGPVARLKNDFTRFPSNFSLGRLNQDEFAKQAAEMIAQELLFVGVNFNLAPVVDVFTEQKNPIIGIRAFSSDPNFVTNFSRKAIEGYKKNGVICSLKHFPGHGDVKVDTHESLGVIGKSLEQMKLSHLLPFKELAKEADVVMTAHLILNDLDPYKCATLSKKLLDYLKQELGFEGVILTDSLLMKGVLENSGSLEIAAKEAILAGCHLLLIGGDALNEKGECFSSNQLKSVISYLKLSVENKTLDMELIDQAFEKIIKLKEKYLFKKPAISNSYTDEEKKEFVELVAKMSLLIPDGFKKISLTKSGCKILAPNALKQEMQKSKFLKAWPHIYFYDESLNESIKATPLIFLSSRSWKNEKIKQLMQLHEKINPEFLLVSLYDELDLTYIKTPQKAFVTYNPTYVSLNALYDELFESQ